MAEVTAINETPMIYAKITEVMKLIGAVGKTAECNAPGARFHYRGIDQLMNALQPALIRAGVFPIPEVLSVDRQERVNAKGTVLTFTTVKVKYRFYASDGSYVEATVAGEGMDSGDKSVNKALSAAYKYAAFQVFCIPTEEMRDPDAQVYTDVMYQGYQAQVQQPYQPQQAAQEYIPEGYPQDVPVTKAQNLQRYPQPEQPPQQAYFANLNDAYNYIISFGKNKGKAMGMIASQPKSREELEWFRTARPDSREAAAAGMILASRVM